MRNVFIKISAILLATSLSACNSVDSIDITSQSQISESSSVSSISQTIDTSNKSSDETSNILIAYFTWADNTHVEEPDKVDIDATTSASVLVPGNAAKIADWIHQETGGDLFSIIVTEPYSSDYNECLNRAADEKAKNARPQLTEHIDDMEKYDIVFLGFPNWWYTVPMAIHTFLEEYDFSGKIVIPFVTHGTGGLASTITDIKADLPEDVTMLDPIGVYRPEVDSSHDKVIEWLKTLDILKEDL